MDVARVLILLLQILQMLILVRVVMSWVAPDSRGGFAELIRGATDPVLRPIQALLPGTGPVDFSPMIALFLIFLLQNLIAGGI